MKQTILQADPHYLFRFFNKLYKMVFLMKVTKQGYTYELVSDEAAHLASLPGDYYGKTIEELYPAEISRPLIDQYDSVHKEKTPVFYADKMNKRDSGITYASSILMPIEDWDGKVAYILSMTSELADEAEQQLITSMENIDYLTKLPNLVKAKHEINKYLQLETPPVVYLLYINIDRFRLLNELCGVEEGNRMLQKIALGIGALLPDRSIFGRVDGDEFMVALIDQEEELVLRTAEKIMEMMEGFHYVVSEVKITLTACVGISSTAENANLLVSNASTAMMEAKEEGKNTVKIFRESDRARKYMDELLLEIELMKAIEKQELRVYYQPKVQVENGQVNYEALVRWFSPKLGTVSPGKFIPLAEKSPLIEKITVQVMDIVCRDMEKYPEIFAGARVGVNLSANLFEEAIIQRTLLKTIEKHKLYPEMFELELTETMLIKNPEKGKETIDYLRNLGFRVVIDDFGVSYSSLNYLKMFTFDGIKIDQSFVQEIDKNIDRKEYEIVNFMLTLARKLGLFVTAEGVETLEQLKVLSSLGCDEIQGYYLSRPQSLEFLSDSTAQAKNKMNEAKKRMPEGHLLLKEASGENQLFKQPKPYALPNEIKEEEAFDRITRTVRAFFQMPMSYITFIQDNKQSIKSSCGMPQEIMEVGEVELEKTICKEVVSTKKGLIISDVKENAKWSENEFVEEYGIRFYASVPLKSREGEVVGTLCLLDMYPRSFTKEQYMQLTDFSYWAMSELEKTMYPIH